MKEKLLRVAVPILCLGLVQCTSNTTTTDGPPTAFATVRLNPTTGTADSGFGGTGIVVTQIDPTLFGFAMAAVVQPSDNRIVVGGSNGLGGQGQIALVRYNTNGTPDSGFGTGGIVKTPLPLPTLPASATAIVIQPVDFKIVVAALAFQATTNGAGNTSIVLLRYNPNGTLDNTFGTNGIAAAAAIGSGNAGDTCALLAQGTKFVVAGGSRDGNIVLYRYDSTGALDTTFGALATPGKTTTNLGVGTSTTPPAMAAQSDGRIIVTTGNGSDQVVMRYSVDGALDAAFGGVTGGIVTTDIGSSINYANAVAIQSTGAPANLDNIVVVGHTGVSSNTSDISVVRYTKDGVLDTTNFGAPNGFVTTDIAGQFDNAFSVVLQDLGGGEPRILVSGNTGLNGTSQTVVLRYISDGTLDPSFGSAGIGLVVVPRVLPSTIASGNAIVLQPGAGIVVTGYD